MDLIVDLAGERKPELTYELSGKAELEAAVKEVEAKGVRALAVGCDVTRADQVEAAVAATVDAFGQLDVLVNTTEWSTSTNSRSSTRRAGTCSST